MKDINYAYYSGALEALLESLPTNVEFNRMSIKEKSDYISEHIKRLCGKAIEYNKPL